MFTDMVGYTAISQRDEALALDLLRRHREVIRPVVAEHRGREVKTIGDAFLVEFGSALDALDCAIEIQMQLHKDARSKNEIDISVRIGLHVGDVVHSENDVYGDAVNLASRVEGTAEPGGVALTGQVYDTVRNRTGHQLEYLGVKNLKNVEVPVEVYRVTFPWSDKVLPAAAEFASPSQPPGLEGPVSNFVGREEERTHLERAFDGVVKSSKSNVVFVSGEAGIGKTKLADWLAEVAVRKHHALVAQGNCLEEVSVPYFPFSEAISRLLGQAAADNALRQVTNWLDSALERVFPEEGQGEKFRVMERVTRLVEGICRATPLLIRLEDVHWSDTASLGLLHYIARNARDSRLMVLCTFRPEELGENGPSRRYDLLETIGMMKREGLGETLELGRLPSEATEEIVRSLIPAASVEVLGLVTSESEGNPLFAVELARYLADSGTSREGEGVWRLTEKRGGRVLPDAVQEVIERRINRLPQGQREILECASVLGEHFGIPVVARALRKDELEVIRQMTKLCEETRLVREDEGGYRFDHAMVRDTVRGGLSPALRGALHRRIGESLKEMEGDYPASEIAFHFHEAGVKDETAKAGLRAGDQARRQFASAEAVTYYTWVTEAAREDGADDESRSKALLGRAEAYAELGKHERAVADAEVAVGSKDPYVRQGALLRLAQSWGAMGQFGKAMEYVKRGKEEGGEALLRLRLEDQEAHIIGYRGEPREAIIRLKRIAEAMKAMGKRKEYAEVLLELSEFSTSILDMKGAFDQVKEASAVAEAVGDVEERMSAMASLGDLHFSSGNVTDGVRTYEEAAAIANRIGRFRSTVWIHLYCGLLHESAGNYKASLEQSLKALDDCRLIESPYAEAAVQANLTRGYLRMGRGVEAEEAYLAMNTAFERGSDASLTLQSAVARSRGYYLWAKGLQEEADEAYRQSIEKAHSGPYGSIQEAETRREYATLLASVGRRRDSEEQAAAAKGVYEALGNRLGAESAGRFASSPG